ncbi:MAG: class I SAM-dependent methyltransferase [Leptolyngbyaceae cyanobacterium]|mgnify:FL=1
MDYRTLKQRLDGYASRELSQRTTWYSSVAAAYNQVRPRYPASLVAQVIDTAALSSESAILEVGCGPGTATVSFAPLGCSVVCVEPNPDFAHLAKLNCRTYPNVRIDNVSFEEWPLAENSFDAVLAATSFHWIPAEVAYAKAAQALKENGRLILLWNKELQPSYAVYQRLADVYRHHAPSLARYEDRVEQERILQNLGDMVSESRHFRDGVSGHMISNVVYTTVEYLTLLTTYSPYLQLDPSVANRLFENLRSLIDRDFDGKLELTYTSAFHIARKV